MHAYIEDLHWRYATKKFNPNQEISSEDLETLLEAVRLSASSYGLQPYKVLVIKDPAIKEQLRPAAWNQSQITDASHVLVFANMINFGDEGIDAYIERTSEVREVKKEDLKGYADFMKSKISTLPKETRDQWTAKQAYIALGNLLSAAAALHIDACPMEGFESEKFNEILGLTEKGLNAVVIAAVGYRSEEDQTQYQPKVRKTHENLFIHL